MFDDTPTQPEQGLVYFIWHPRGFCKIGYSLSGLPTERLSALQCGSPYELQVIYYIRAVDPFALERDLHEHFQDIWVRGEWFSFGQTIRLAAAMKQLGFGVKREGKYPKEFHYGVHPTNTRSR